jgi:hypothetical protein
LRLPGRKCNKCGRKLPAKAYKTDLKKTCKSCEYRWWRSFLRTLVQQKRLSPAERMASRVGYMGAAFLMAGQWTVEPALFIIGFCCVLVQVTFRKQWNLVVLQLNGLIAWTIHFVKTFLN